MNNEQTVYVVTNPENGWDCLIGVFSDEDYVKETYKDKERFVIFEQVVSTAKLENNEQTR